MPGQEITAVVHDRVTAHEVHHAGHRKQGDVLGQDFGGVLGRTRPASSMAKPAAIHMTSAPQTRNMKGVECKLQFENVVFHAAP